MIAESQLEGTDATGRRMSTRAGKADRRAVGAAERMDRAMRACDLGALAVERRSAL